MQLARLFETKRSLSEFLIESNVKLCWVMTAILNVQSPNDSNVSANQNILLALVAMFFFKIAKDTKVYSVWKITAGKFN